jgi:hypothetical protein
MSFLPAKNLIFLQDLQNNFKFLVDSGASVSILLHSSSAPPTGPHLVGANGKQITAWGFRRRTVCFYGQNFDFNFLLAAVAAPILGMDFFAKFELSIIPSKQQVLHAASGRTFTKASTTPFISPWSSETAAAALPPQVQQLLEEFPSLLRPSAAPLKPLHGVVLTSTLCSPALGGWTRRNTASPKKNFSPWRKQVLFAAQTHLGRPRCTWSPRRMGRNAPAATTAVSTPSQFPTDTPSPTCSPSMTAWPGALFFRKSI